MSKIKLTDSQIKMIQEHEKSIGKRIVLKIDKTQYSRLFESKGNPSDYIPQTEKENEKTTSSFENLDESIMDTISQMNPEFISNVLESFKDFLNDPSQEGLSPFWKENGITWGDYKTFLVGTGLFSVVMLGGHETLRLIRGELNRLDASGLKRRLMISAGKHLFNTFIGKRYDMKNGGKVINKEDISLGNDFEIAEDGGYPAGAENDPNAPWNQSDERDDSERQAKQNYFTMIKGFGEFALIQDPRGDKYYVDLSNFYYDPNADEDFIINKINVAVEDGELKVDNEGDNLFKLNVISKITLANKELLLDNTFDTPEIESYLNDLTEMTSTGSVGGSYVTPKIWAKSPKDAKFGETPMIKGGKMVKEKLTELDKVSMERFVAELDMYIYAEDIAHAQIEGEQITRLINKKFDANARISNIVPKKFGANLGESVEKRKGQITFDDCTKLDNNTEAQDGGCSVGAVDNVVKVVGEDVYEAVALKTGKTVNEVKEIIQKNKKNKKWIKN